MENQDLPKEITLPDPSQFKKGYGIFKGNIVDADGNPVHPIIYKKYSSNEEYAEDCARHPVEDEDDEDEFDEEFDNDLDILHAGAPRDSFLKKDLKGNVTGVNINPLAEYLIEARHVLSTTGTKREMFIYDNGVYTEGEDTLRRDIRHLVKGHANISIIREVLELIKDLTFVDRESLNVDVRLINLNNGVYDIGTDTLLPHDPKYYFFSKIPVDYDKNADCPVTRKFLSEVLLEEHIPAIQEWYGYILYREYFIKKAIILVGYGDTGKTTLISQFCAFAGEKNVATVSLQKLTRDRFSSSALHHKLLNFYDDLSSKDINDNGIFKMAAGGGYMAGEKKFKDPFPFKNFAKLTFACNQIPEVKDVDDDAYFLRWIVIPFNNVIDDDKKDAQLIHKLTTPAELSGVFNFALDGLRRLLKNHKFSYSKDIHEIRTEMMRSASTVARFASDCMEEAKDEWISKDDLYHAYSNYVSNYKIKAVSKETFGKRIQMHAPYMADFRPKKPTGGQITAWRNVRVKSSGAESYPEDDWFDQEPIEEPPIAGISE